MQTLPAALQAFSQFRQFILYKLVPGKRPGKLDKIPVNPRTRGPFEKGSDWQKNPELMSDFATASANLIPGYGIGFLFSENDPFFFLDIDNCLNTDGASWSTLALELINYFPGAAVEVSSSGKGLHIFGVGAPSLPHGNKNESLKIEFYTHSRFVALTGANIIGDASTPCGPALNTLVAKYFPQSAAVNKAIWSSEPVDEWRGPLDDSELIEKMLNSGSASASSVFSGKSNIQALWECDEDALSKSYPDSERPFDASQADAALAQHLAFWTGNNCDRILVLMWQSGLVREKWSREDYLERTILRAVSLQDKFYCEIDLTIVDKFGAGRVDASSDAQRDFAERIRAQVVSKCSEAQAVILCQTRTNAKFWLDNQDKTPEQLVTMLKPLESVKPTTPVLTPELVSGYQYLSATLMIEKFAGCVYVRDLHRILTPNGALLKSEQFNAVFGGYVFQVDERGDKTTRKAWEAFTESQCVRFPKADTTIFKPKLDSGAFIDYNGFTAVNTYVPIETPRVKGDLKPFLTHLEKLLPDANDREILLSYMAACVQHKGVKFQWCPLIQGAPGNGKTLLTRCVKFAVGERYSYMPKAKDLTSKFNAWLVGKIFIGVEDIFVPEAKKEILEELKPMITGGDGYEIEGKGIDQYNTHLCCNFILNSNHKDAIRKTLDDRRFAVFYTAQQTALDLSRDGMDGDYFPDLYNWLDNGGYEIVNEFLHTYQIKNEFNPAAACHRAPMTSSTNEALTIGLGSVEQEILEAIAESRPGFTGGWVSSVALERLLKDLRAERAIPQNKRREVMRSLGYDWHPHLKDGRVNNAIPMDDNKKPRLYIKNGHLALQQEKPFEIARMYVEAQGSSVSSTGKAQEVFKS